jgi:hypothetical protein
MPIRDAKQAAEEQVIFDAFLSAHPSFAATVTGIKQPDAEFPDVIVTQEDGQIEFELAQWLHTAQTIDAKRRERLAKAIEDAIGEQGRNSSRHFGLVLLFPKSDHLRFKQADVRPFHMDVWTLIEEIERRWRTEPFWHSPQGCHVCELDAYPTIGKYVSRVIFDPLIVAGSLRDKFSIGVPWIVVAPPVHSYSPNTAISALNTILQAKIRAYGDLQRPVRLLVYYAAAIAYNTPWYGINFRKFQDVAKTASQIVSGQSRFERIYLLKALEPGLEAYEVFPNFEKCG